MPKHTEFYSMLRNIYRMFVVVGFVLAAAACRSDRSTPDFETTFDDATVALEANRVEQSQELADCLRDLTLGADSDLVDEHQAARLAIFYMKLSERNGEDENIADATHLFRRAFRLSKDSLRTFYESLPLEDTPHYVLLRRLGLSIDNPVDLTDRDIAEEETLPAIADSTSTLH